jgi:hypothetical protein
MLGDSGYQSGGTIGGKLGCAVSAVIGLPMAGLMLFFSGSATTDCGHSKTCSPAIELITNLLFLSAVLLVIGFGIRLGVNGRIAIFRRLRAARR